MKLGYWALLSFHVNDLGVDKLGDLTLQEDSDKRNSSLTALKHSVRANEVFYLATCNRVEFLFYSDSPLDISKFPWRDYKHRSFGDLESIITHLIRVAVGRDSVVLGENQILGQFKTAFETAKENKLTNTVLNTVLQIIVRETKALRTKVRIANYPTSISTVAGKLMIDEMSDVNAPILLVGFSETHQILARYLKKWKYNNIIWTNRTNEKLDTSHPLVDKIITWEKFLKGDLPKLTGISVATRSERYVLSESALERAKPKLVIDLSVPANADQTLVERFESRYIGISQISELLSKKKREAQSQLSIIDDYIEMKTQFILGEMAVRFSNQFFIDMLKSAEDIFNDAFVDGKGNHFAHLDTESVESIEVWSRKLVKKVSHQHLEALKSIVPHTDRK